MQALTRHAGLWAGTNRFRLMPEDPPAEADATARLSLGAGGNVAVQAYTWSIQTTARRTGCWCSVRTSRPAGWLRSGATPGTRSLRPSSCVVRPATTR